MSGPCSSPFISTRSCCKSLSWTATKFVPLISSPPPLPEAFRSRFFFDFFLSSRNKAAIILLLGEIWDAVTDPLIGTLCDNTNTRLGRRRPWLLLGFLFLLFLFLFPSFKHKFKKQNKTKHQAALPFGYFYFMLWLAPPLIGFWQVVYYFAMFVIFKTFQTSVRLLLFFSHSNDMNEKKKKKKKDCNPTHDADP